VDDGLFFRNCHAEATEKSTVGIKEFHEKKPGHRKKLASTFVSIVDMEQPPNAGLLAKMQ
jgi:hypothetical protein